MAQGSCAVRAEPLEGMLFLTESGSARTAQRDSFYKRKAVLWQLNSDLQARIIIAQLH